MQEDNKEKHKKLSFVTELSSKEQEGAMAENQKLLDLPLPLKKALETHDVDKFRRLTGPSFSYRDKQDNNLLHLAIIHQDPKKRQVSPIFEDLLNKPIDKDHKNIEGLTPLHLAFKYHQQACAIELIKAGCNLDIYFSNEINKPLHMCTELEWPQVAQLLLAKGVHVDERNASGKSALMLVAEQCHSACCSWAYRAKLDIIYVLLLYGADPLETFNNHLVRFEEENNEPIRKLNSFDILLMQQRHSFHGQFCAWPDWKILNLSVVVLLTNSDEELFSKLMDNVNGLSYEHIDLMFFLKKFNDIRPRIFQRFLGQFEWIVVKAFQESQRLDELLYCDDESFASLVDDNEIPILTETMTENLCENMSVLLQTNIVSTIVNKLNSTDSLFMVAVLENITRRINPDENMMGIIWLFLSYGVDPTAELLDKVYSRFGYCEDFKRMLYFDVKINTTPRYVVPTLYYDPQLLFEDVSRGGPYDYRTTCKLERYFSLHSGGSSRTPTLTELARNAIRTFIITKYKPQNSLQYYMRLNSLPLYDRWRRLVALDLDMFENGKMI